MCTHLSKASKIAQHLLLYRNMNMHMQSNRLESMSGIEVCEGLEELYLSHNGISEIQVRCSTTLIFVFSAFRFVSSYMFQPIELTPCACKCIHASISHTQSSACKSHITTHRTQVSI